jgi:hypothetical protein
MKLMWIVVGAVVVILVFGGYLSIKSGLTDLGPVITQFSSAFGKVIGGTIMIISGFSLTGMLIHYHILKRGKKKNSETNEIAKSDS